MGSSYEISEYKVFDKDESLEPVIVKAFTNSEARSTAFKTTHFGNVHYFNLRANKLKKKKQ